MVRGLVVAAGLTAARVHADVDRGLAVHARALDTFTVDALVFGLDIVEIT
jgi:hypothetical protein